MGLQKMFRKFWKLIWSSVSKFRKLTFNELKTLAIAETILHEKFSANCYRNFSDYFEDRD